jgi:hypothetical protein
MRLLKRDPGPCIVCGAPHTTCTSADYDPKTPTRVVVVTDGSAKAFTTATYRRRDDSRRARRENERR